MYVYLIKQRDKNLYKVGVSKHPEKRFKQIQMSNPNKLELLETWESEWSWKIETWFKNLWKPYQIHGEWFQLNDDNVNKLFLEKCEMSQRNWDEINNDDHLFIF